METCIKGTTAQIEAVIKDLADLESQLDDLAEEYPRRVLECKEGNILNLISCLLEADTYANGKADMLTAEIEEDLASLPETTTDLTPIIKQCTDEGSDFLQSRLAALAASPLNVGSCLV